VLRRGPQCLLLSGFASAVVDVHPASTSFSRASASSSATACSRPSLARLAVVEVDHRQAGAHVAGEREHWEAGAKRAKVA
jgi:hypothetical protein